MEIDELEETTSWSSNVTGVANTIFISPHKIAVAIDPPNTPDPRGQVATITLDGDITGEIDPELARQLQRFVELNRAVLLEYEEIYTDELQRRLQAI